MKKLALVFGVVLLGSVVIGNFTNSYATYFGSITIPDTLVSGSPESWYNRTSSGTNPGGEDNEIEPGCLTGQGWDLEGFFVDTTINKFVIVGGYDFKNGNQGYASGDIFVGNDPKYGATVPSLPSGDPNHQNDPISNLFGYKWAIHLNFNTSTGGTYDLYGLDNSTLLEVWYNQNYQANPWRYSKDATETHINYGTFTFLSGLTDAQVGFDGDGSNTHYAIEIPLSGLPVSGDWYFHYTYQCGNDFLMGHGNLPTPPVPEPATMFLLGSGLVGLAGFARKKFRK